MTFTPSTTVGPARPLSTFRVVHGDTQAFIMARDAYDAKLTLLNRLGLKWFDVMGKITAEPCPAAAQSNVTPIKKRKSQ